jgi:hypothetical protein
MRLDNLYQKNGNHVAWMSIEALVVFLSLENVDKVSPLNGDARNVKYLILSLLLVIWWIWNFELLLIPLVIDLHETKLGEAVLESNAVESDTPNLHSNGALSWPSGIDALEERFFDDKLSHGLLHMGIFLGSLF